MAVTTSFTLGEEASCSDGVCGEVSRVVLDPTAWTVTHLVVKPRQEQEPGRLVALDLIDATAGEIPMPQALGRTVVRGEAGRWLRWVTLKPDGLPGSAAS